MSSRFHKAISVIDIFAVSFGAMIGWGWVVSCGTWIQNAGVFGTVIGFIFGGIMIYFVGMTYAELISAMPRAGGEHIFSYRAFGITISFICTWTLIFSYMGVVCFEAVSLPKNLYYIFPELAKYHMYTIAGADVYMTSIIISGISTAIIVMINILGIKAASVFQNILTMVIAIVGIIFIIASAINGSADNLENQFITGKDAEALKDIISVAVIAPFFLFGFDIIPQVAEEVNIPLKNIGKALLFSIICAVAFYGFAVFAVGYSLNANEINNIISRGGLVTASAMEKVFSSKVMAKLLIFAGLCGIITSWNSFLIGCSRAIFSMSEAHMIPPTFSKINSKHKTPVNALLLIGLLSLAAPFLGDKMLVWISNTSSFACCITYYIVSMSFIVLRKKEPNMKRPYKVKHYKFVGITSSILSGFMTAMYLIPGTGSTFTIHEWTLAGIWLILGLIFYRCAKNRYKDTFGKIYS